MSTNFFRLFICLFSLLLSSLPAFAQGAWETKADLPTQRTEVAVAELNGKIYVFGGFLGNGAATSVVEVYDVTQDRWTSVSPVPIAIHHIGAAAVDGKVYAVGGLGRNFAPVNTLFEYDPTTNQWAQKANLPVARGAMAVAVDNGKIYAIGGQTPSFDLAQNAVYDPQTDSWQALAPMPTPREHVAAAAIRGMIYVAGGRQGSLATNRRTLEVYDPDTNTWKSLPDMPTARGGLAAAALNGRLYVFGGEANSGTFSQNEEFDPATATWRNMAPMPTARHGLGAVSFAGKIYVIGGGPQPGLFVSSANEVFTPPATGVDDPDAATIKDFRLFQNYPNPWKRNGAFPQTTIRYHLPEKASVTVTVYNFLGQRVRTLLHQIPQAAGEHFVNWDGRNDDGRELSSGIYFYRLEAGNRTALKKLVVVRQ
jgi:N-acetylneuraminic acid mutarotase